MKNIDIATAIERVMRQAAKAGTTQEKYWAIRAAGMDAIANAIIGKGPVDRVVKAVAGEDMEDMEDMRDMEDRIEAEADREDARVMAANMAA